MSKRVILYVGFAILCAGCLSNPAYHEPEHVDLPTFCNIEMPPEPTIDHNSNNLTQNLKKVLIYKDQLKMRLHCCRGDKECITRE